MATVKREDGRSARMPAAERREAIIEAATASSPCGGLHGTATEDIARRAGITQPYVFRLFGTKKALFLATVERCFDRVQRAFEAAAAGPSPARGCRRWGRAYGQLLRDRSLLLMQMQSYAACADPDVRGRRSPALRRAVRWVEEVSGAARRGGAASSSRPGMLLNVIAAMDLPRADEPLGGGLPGRARSRD